MLDIITVGSKGVADHGSAHRICKGYNHARVLYVEKRVGLIESSYSDDQNRTSTRKREVTPSVAHTDI